MATPEFTKPIICPRCGNEAPMRIVASYRHSLDRQLKQSKQVFNYWEDWRLLCCHACEEICVGIILDYIRPSDEFSIKILYPIQQNTSIDGLPPDISRTYEAALKVRAIDSNAFAVLLGRVLEKVCSDRQAEGNSLYERLNSLAAKGEIPQRLADMAHQLRQLRNIGAHADLGELTPKEVPVLMGLCKAILEYVYTASYLTSQVENLLKELKK